MDNHLLFINAGGSTQILLIHQQSIFQDDDLSTRKVRGMECRLFHLHVYLNYFVCFLAGESNRIFTS